MSTSWLRPRLLTRKWREKFWQDYQPYFLRGRRSYLNTIDSLQMKELKQLQHSRGGIGRLASSTCERPSSTSVGASAACHPLRL